jgi:hypothetical protein
MNLRIITSVAVAGALALSMSACAKKAEETAPAADAAAAAAAPAAAEAAAPAAAEAAAPAAAEAAAPAAAAAAAVPTGETRMQVALDYGTTFTGKMPSCHC